LDSRSPPQYGTVDDADAIDEGFIVLVGFEGAPFGLVGMRQYDAGKGDRADILGADIVALPNCGSVSIP
jgi:hypothetical protein